MTRRELLRLLAAAAALRCASVTEDTTARLTARPRPGTTKLMLLLHGAGGRGARIRERYQPAAETFGFAIVAPDAQGATWDVIRGTWGPDVASIDRELQRFFSERTIDPKHVGICGFSDGASYALSLGLTNGDLFSHVLAFSPGFARPASKHGSPHVFIAHGTEDEILPVANTRALVARLRADRYDVRYDEFRGPHRTPEAVANAGFAWFSDSSIIDAHVRM